MKMFQFQSQYQPGESPYQIFQNRMTAITSIVQGIKESILNKYNKGVVDTIIGQIEKSRTAQEATDMINLLEADPGEEIYPSGIEDMAGQFVDYTNTMMKGREGMPSPGMLGQGVPPTGTPTGTPTSEVMLPKGDRMQFLDAFQKMGGQMDFAPILKYMQEHRPKFMGSFSPTEQWALNKAMGQFEDPKKELGESLDLAKKYEEFFREPTGEKTWEQTLKEANEFIINNPDYEISAMNPKTGSLSITKKSVSPEVDWEKVSEQVEEFGLKLTSMNVNPTTGNVSYSFGAGTGISWEETLAKANQFMQDNPDYEVTSTNPKTGSVTISKKGTETTDKVTTAEINLVEQQFANVKTNAQYNTALATVRQTDKNVIVPTKEEIFKSNYNKAKTAIMKTAIDINTGKIREGDYKEGLSYVDVYKALYEDLETAIREYQLATGQLLENPFLSFEEYEKTDVKPREILSPSTWDQQKSIFKDEFSIGETKTIKDKTYEYQGGGKWKF